MSPALRHSTILSDFQSVEECAVLPNLANNVLVPIPKFMPEKNVLVEPVDIARELELKRRFKSRVTGAEKTTFEKPATACTI